MVAFEILKDPSRNRLKFVMLNASVHWLINFFLKSMPQLQCCWLCFLFAERRVRRRKLCRAHPVGIHQLCIEQHLNWPHVWTHEHADKINFKNT